jgi:AsmA protein
VLKAAVVATAEGQGGRERDRLAGLTVPVRLHGSFDDIKYDVDLRGMAGDAAKSQVGERVKEQIEGRKDKIEERVGERLKGLLRR